MKFSQANHGGVRGKLPETTAENGYDGEGSDDEINGTPENNNNIDEEVMFIFLSLL